ncbi:hypothetical protein [Enterobacter sp.]|uniref:hypothetical protein n=1 Tax=Enterobacter sp. TaxID=42895 RepID=UPI00296EDBA4|nr:hypothetical protein [Enterobacter sp.]
MPEHENEHHSLPASEQARDLRDWIAQEVDRQLTLAWQKLVTPHAHAMPAENVREVIKEVTVEVVRPDPLRAALTPLLSAVATLRDDRPLQEAWLRGPLSDDEAEQIQQVLAIASHWDRIERLWDVLAVRAKEGSLTPDVFALLTFAISLHNRLWVDRFALLENVEAGCAYNFEMHNGTGTGERIARQLLPGLINNAGKRCRKPLVLLQP